jgi:hypothetical protein
MLGGMAGGGTGMRMVGALTLATGEGAPPDDGALVEGLTLEEGDDGALVEGRILAEADGAVGGPGGPCPGGEAEGAAVGRLANGHSRMGGGLTLV